MNILMLNYEYPPIGSGGAAGCKLCRDDMPVLGTDSQGNAQRK